MREYNWDNGFDFPRKLLGNPECDLALALEIFYLADGYAYLLGGAEGASSAEWRSFIERLYEDILQGRYIRTAAAFENPLNKVQRFKLKKQQVPDIFLVDL